MKKSIKILAVSAFALIGAVIGYVIATYVLPFMGATFITASDIVVCYFISIFLSTLFGFILVNPEKNNI